jgi:hypothetical protein
VLDHLHYKDKKLNNEVKYLKAKLEIEATWYEMQVRVLKTHSQL